MLFELKKNKKKNHPSLFSLMMLSTLAAAITAAACRGASTDGEEGPDAGPATSDISSSKPASNGEGADGGETPTGPAGTGAATGLPCDVQGVIENRCIACHGAKAPPPLLTFEDLTAKSQKDPTKTMAEMSVLLLKSKMMPPPPAVPPEDDELAAFENWVKGGTKKNPEACTKTPAPPSSDGGVVATDGGGTTAPPPVEAGVGDGGCTSGKFWTQGEEGSPLMHPGGACSACHQQKGGPNLRIAGTVFPTLREPIDCIGSAPPPQIQVTITDSRTPTPRTITLDVNASGNFSTQQRLTLPIKAVVREGTKTRAMQGTVNSGDCNSCHTQNGANNAPGRILAPQ